MSREENEYMTVAEVASLLRISKPSVHAAVKRQGLPAVRLGRVVRFARADVEEWIKKQKEPGHGGRAA